MGNERQSDVLSGEEWDKFNRAGYVKLGQILTDLELSALSERIDAIMTGKAGLDYDRLMMQREAGEGYKQSEQTLGFKGATLNYRKIENLEFDPLFLSFIQKPLFRGICRQMYRKEDISCFRAMFMNKPARHGSVLAYHQDRWNDLNIDPLVTIWTALDDATVDNGCVRIFPGSHGALVNPSHMSGFLTPEQTERLSAESQPVPLEVKAGESVLLHNWTVHGSDGNITERSRRAFSVCYMDADTRSADGTGFSRVFGAGALEPAALGR